MGKRFYASDKNKVVAGRKANKLARRFRKAVCWTPARERDCKFDAKTGLWTCFAKAHYHSGSCGTWEISPRGRGTPWQVGWTWEHDVGGQPKSAAPPDAGEFEAVADSEHEEYVDAEPADYEDMEDDDEALD